jgi:hypothetical protein
MEYVVTPQIERLLNNTTCSTATSCYLIHLLHHQQQLQKLQV